MAVTTRKILRNFKGSENFLEYVDFYFDPIDHCAYKRLPHLVTLPSG